MDFPRPSQTHSIELGSRDLEDLSIRQISPPPARNSSTILFAWKFFFQTLLQGHEHAQEPLPVYVIVRLMPGTDPDQLSMLYGDLDRPSWWQHHLFGIHSITGTLKLVPSPGMFVTIEHLRLRLASFKPSNDSPSQGLF
ncbi:hypothetical protein TNCV_4708551 [Trichonephila clavipes]|nr:hypothetical protein TNCV_4708551 [Trichonephila clavipes]